MVRFIISDGFEKVNKKGTCISRNSNHAKENILKERSFLSAEPGVLENCAKTNAGQQQCRDCRNRKAFLFSDRKVTFGGGLPVLLFALHYVRRVDRPRCRKKMEKRGPALRDGGWRNAVPRCDRFGTARDNVHFQTDRTSRSDFLSRFDFSGRLDFSGCFGFSTTGIRLAPGRRTGAPADAFLRR